MLRIKEPKDCTHLVQLTVLSVNKSSVFCVVKEGKKLYQAPTLDNDHKVRTYAEIIGDGELISKLLAGDMIAQALEYHLYCLIKLYRQAAACQSLQDDSAYPEIVAKAQVFRNWCNT